MPIDSLRNRSKRTPSNAQNPRCVELVLAFENGNVLAIEHVPFGTGYAFAEGRAGAPPNNPDLPDIAPFLWGEGDASYALVPAAAQISHVVGAAVLTRPALVHSGALVACSQRPGFSRIAVPPDGTLHVSHAGLSWSVRAVERAASARKAALTLAPYRWTLASAAVHGVILASLLFAPPPTRGLCMDALARDDLRFVSAALLAAQQEDPPPVIAVGDAGGREGQAHTGEEGSAGDPKSPRTVNRGGVKQRQPSPALPRETSAENAAQAGILGVLAKMADGLNAPSSPYGSGLPSGYDDADALGALVGAQLGANAGSGGLGMRNAGRGGGGDGLGTIGLGKLGTIGAYGSGGEHAGYGTGVGKIGGRTAKVPVMLGSNAEVRGSLSKETIRRVIQRHLNEVRFCYEQGLAARPDLAGRVQVRFIIAPSGAVSGSQVETSTLTAPSTEACIRDAVRRWAFPAPDGGGVVIVSYPFVLQSAG